jgi:NTP pyrophosphatase (non-canonical NTP hydrolase)
MKLNEYQELSKRTMPKEEFMGVIGYTNEHKSNYAMGLSGETGEVVDVIKKEIFHGHPENKEKVKDELGDVLHYLSGLATMYGLTLEEVATHNINKLYKRYPQGFNSVASINRME